MLDKLEILKKQYCDVMYRLTNAQKTENEQSIPYLVGDMLKRNFKTLT